MKLGTMSLLVAFSLVSTVAWADAQCPRGLLPDLQTVVPKHLGIQNANQREALRFSNGIANRGAGHWQMRPITDPGTTQIVDAVQDVLDADGNIVCTFPVGEFLFHPEHNHWHISDVALFEVRLAKDDGTRGTMGKVLRNDRGLANSIKTTFCLIDWYKLDDNAPTSERIYFDCATSLQGIQTGWVDQYHQSLEGQQLDVTGAPAGIYYLLSTANPDCSYVESDCGNNSAWTSFRLKRDSKGNAKIEEIAHSPCDTPGMCGEQAVNR